jgi:hypothetical protein
MRSSRPGSKSGRRTAGRPMAQLPPPRVKSASNDGKPRSGHRSESSKSDLTSASRSPQTHSRVKTIVRCGGGCVTPEVRFGSRSEAWRKTRCCCCRSGKHRSRHRMLVMRRIANPSAIGETAVECRWPSWCRMSGDAVGRGRTVRWRWTRHDGHGVRRRAARANVAAAGHDPHFNAAWSF